MARSKRTSAKKKTAAKKARKAPAKAKGAAKRAKTARKTATKKATRKTAAKGARKASKKAQKKGAAKKARAPARKKAARPRSAKRASTGAQAGGASQGSSSMQSGGETGGGDAPSAHRQGRIEVRNVNVPGYRSSVDARKYEAMRSILLEALPGSPPGMTQNEVLEAIIPRLPDEHFPQGEKAGWWFKAVQLDQEARGAIKRSATKPLRWSKA